MNPKVNDIFAAISRLNRAATKVTITGTVSYPDWDGANDHIQGIAPKNGTRETRGGRWPLAAPREGGRPGAAPLGGTYTGKSPVPVRL